MAAEDILYYGAAVIIALVGALFFLRLRNRTGGGGPAKLTWYVMRTVQNRRQVVAQGKVPNTAESFRLKNHTYHVDLAKVQQDAGGHQYLNYDYGYFEPLSTGDVPDDESGLKVHPSADAHMVLNTGWIRQMLGMISGKSGLSIMMIVMAVMGGVMGYFVGSAAPISSLMGGTTVNYATISYTASSTYTSGGLSYTTTYATYSLSKIPAGYYTLTSVTTVTGTQTVTSASYVVATSYLSLTVPFSTTKNFTLTTTQNHTLTSNVTYTTSLLVYVPYNVTITHTNSTTQTITHANSTVTETQTFVVSSTTTTTLNQTTTTTTTTT